MAPEHFPLFHPEKRELKQRPLVEGDMVSIKNTEGPHSHGYLDLYEEQIGEVKCFPNNDESPNGSRIVEVIGKNLKNGNYWSFQIPEDELVLIE